MSAASTETSAGSRVFFQGAPGVGCVGSGPINGEDPVQKKQGKVTVKYDRKELRKRLVLEEWIIEQLSDLYDCEEDEMPEVEIDIDDLLEVNNDDERASKLQVRAFPILLFMHMNENAKLYSERVYIKRALNVAQKHKMYFKYK
uniref:Protein phosphatase 1, regulatory (inhibitor) subunit 14C n=1 Tax=Oryzias latipes TaxID=8090 RepID=A0A3B3HX32_ORYLA